MTIVHVYLGEQDSTMEYPWSTDKTYKIGLRLSSYEMIQCVLYYDKTKKVNIQYQQKQYFGRK